MLSFISHGLSMNTRMLVGTVLIIFYLVVIEFMKKDKKDVSKIFSPIIFALVVVFIFILVRNIIEVLR